MSYFTDNISLVRANTDTTSFDSGVITDSTALAYSNLFYPYVLHDGGNSENISLTIDILNKEELDEETQNAVNKEWTKSNRHRNTLPTAKAIWGFKEAYHGVKKSRAISNAFCFGGQTLAFYIEPQGHGTGNVDDSWVYCKTSISVTAIDVVNGTEELLNSFDDFESSRDDSSRVFEWSAPNISDDAFSNYGLFGLVVLRLEISNRYYNDAEWRDEYDGYAPSTNQSHLQLLVYSASKEIIEVDTGDLSILDSTPDYDDMLNHIFPHTVFNDLSSLNLNPLTDAQKSAIIADQIAVIFMSQHPVITADFVPGKIIGAGANEAVEPRKVLERAITYTKRYPKIVPMVKDRLFGMFATYKAFNFASDIDSFIADHNQSSQVIRDPVRAILMDSEGVLKDDIGENGIMFDPFALTVKNAEIVMDSPLPQVLNMDLYEGLVDIDDILITDADGNTLSPYSKKVMVSFSTVYGAENINSIRYTIFTRDSLNYKTYLDETGLSRSHLFNMDRVIVLDPPVNGDIVKVQVDIEDVDGGITSFIQTEGVSGYDASRPFLQDLKIYQRNDGSGIVDVYYIYEASEEINNSYVEPELSVDSGNTWSNSLSTSMTGDFGSNVMPGRRLISWQPSIDLEEVNVTGDVLCRLSLYDADNRVSQGESITGALVWDITQPEVAIRILSIEEDAGEFETSSSTSSSSSSSSSSSFSSSSSSSSSIDSSSSSSSSIDSSSSSSSSEHYLASAGNIDNGGSAYGVWGDGTYIYLANYDGGLRAYTYDGATFTPAGNIDEGGNAYGVWGDGTYIYLANGGDGLRAYTYDGATFTPAGNIDDGGYAYGVWGDGTYIYLANGSDGLRAYTYGGGTFTPAGNIDPVGDAARGVWGDGTYIYLANGSGGLTAYTYDGATFTPAGNIDEGGYAHGVWGDGNRIYLANYLDGLRAYKWMM